MSVNNWGASNLLTLLDIVVSALFSNRSSTNCWWPLMTAIIKQVFPSLSVRSISAPLRISVLATILWPEREAEKIKTQNTECQSMHMNPLIETQLMYSVFLKIVHGCKYFNRDINTFNNTKTQSLHISSIQFCMSPVQVLKSLKLLHIQSIIISNDLSWQPYTHNIVTAAF